MISLVFSFPGVRSGLIDLRRSLSCERSEAAKTLTAMAPSAPTDSPTAHCKLLATLFF